MSTSSALNTFKVRNGGFGVCRWWSSEHEPLSRVRSTGAKEEPRSELVQKKSGCPGQQKQTVSRTGGDGSITANDSARRRRRRGSRSRRMIQRGTADVDDQPSISGKWIQVLLTIERRRWPAARAGSARSRLFSASVQISITPLAQCHCEFVVVRGLAGTSGPVSEATLDVDDDVA